MTVQTTFEHQALFPVKTVTATDLTTPVDGSTPGEAHDTWSKVSAESDTFQALFPHSTTTDWVGAFHYAHPSLAAVQEVGVLRRTSPGDFTDCDSNTGVWFIYWTDDSCSDWPYAFDTFYTTPSLLDARRIVATLLTNIARADPQQSNWRKAVATTVERLDTMTVAEYNTAHSNGLDDLAARAQRRAELHARARQEWNAIKQRRQKLLEELEETVEADRERGYPQKRVLPPALENSEALIQQYVTDELTLEALETELEDRWDDQPLVPFDEYLDALEDNELTF